MSDTRQVLDKAVTDMIKLKDKLRELLVSGLMVKMKDTVLI